MGKYQNSDLHAIYSDWHYRLIEAHPQYKKLWCTDIDRLWVEVDDEHRDIVAVCDLKWDGGQDSVTLAESITYEFFQKNKVPVFVVWCKRDPDMPHVITSFRVCLYGTEKVWQLSPMKYADFLLKLRMAKRAKRGQSNGV